MEKKALLWLIMLVSFLLILDVSFLMYLSSAGAPIKYLKDLPKANAIITNIWLEDGERLDNLREHDVKYLFVDVGGTNSDGTLNTPEREIRSFIKTIHDYENENNYSFILIPYSEINSYEINIRSKLFQKNFIESYQRLSALGFDGILMDIEPVQFKDRKEYLKLLDKLRKTLPKKSILSAYSVSIGSSQNEWAWNPSFYQSVANKVDIITVGSYDTSIENPEEYQDYIRNQVQQISSRKWRSAFLFAVPTHKPSPETPELALSAYQEEIGLHFNHPFIGLVVFAEWTAKPQDWAIIREYLNNGEK